MMQEIIGTSNKILDIDLNTKKVSVYEVSKRERLLYLGAKGLGLKLLFDRLRPGCDPLGPENIIALMPGILMGTGGPCSGRFETIAKSPLTGIMGTSSCGGPFGMALKTAGWDGLLISGKADAPTCLYVTETGVEFLDAAHLWGKEIPDVQRELEGKKKNALIIGPAGENLVRFANIASGHRFSGRGGLGAVMGSKMLKAIVARGGAFKVRPVDPEGFAAARKKGNRYIKQNAMTGDAYRKYGTASNVRPNLEYRILPVHNFQDGWHAEGDQIAGETMAAKHKTSHHTCKPCSILCGHKGIFNGETMAVPEYETVGLMGASIGIFDTDRIAGWNQLCGRLGIDTISTGGTLAWVMEATEKRLVKSDLCFGSPQGVSEALTDIAYRRGFGDEMANGTRALSNKYGGKEFAMHVKGLEMAAYDPRGSYGQGLAYAVANRGACHLSAYMLTQEVYFNLLKADSTIGKARWVKFLEDLTCCVNALQACQFTMYAYLMESPLTKYTPDFILRPLMQYLPQAAIPLVDYSLYLDQWNTVTGLKLSRRDFIKAGERIHILERYMNTREGITRSDDTLPARLISQGRLSDPENKTVPLSKMLPRYYKLRGYDEHGIPTSETLKRLDIV
jgi:aldehyde:ferredoxin oxidoreductase